MRQIQVLDTNVAAQIAAGEVVERPAAVVKELVENAIDAGAKRINVEARGGGIREIKIQDDGHGIPADQVEIAFCRYATSKLVQANDLWDIHTLGFRGEALPSIASVAQVVCITRTAEDEVGTELRIAGSEIQACMPRGCSVGTSMSVRHLFYNTPVRRDYLRSEATEMSAVSMVVQQYALAYPEISFTLLLDGRLALQTAGSGDVRDVLIEMYGVDVARQLLPLDVQYGEGDDAMTITGLISPPGLTRSSRSYIHIFVNRRAIQARGVLVYVIEEAYHTLLMKGKHPLAVFDIRLNPAAIDVNVHPTKSEIRFRYQSRVTGVLGRAIRETLLAGSDVQAWDQSQQTEVASFNPESVPRRFEVRQMSQQSPGESETTNQPSAWQVRPRAWSTQNSRWDVGGYPSAMERALQNNYAQFPDDSTGDDSTGTYPHVDDIPDDSMGNDSIGIGSSVDDDDDIPDDSFCVDDVPNDSKGACSIVEKTSLEPSHEGAGFRDSEPAASPPPVAKLPPLRVVGQVGLTYIVAESPDGMYMIDQHATHERIAYERLMAQRGSTSLDSQELLMAETIHLPSSAVELLVGNREALSYWGFSLDEWGEGMVRVRAIPTILAQENLQDALTEIADHLAGQGGSNPEDWREEILTTLACHTSVRAGQVLSLEEMRELLLQLERCENPRTCPHGRPTMVLLTPGELERQFGRKV